MEKSEKKPTITVNLHANQEWNAFEPRVFSCGDFLSLDCIDTGLTTLLVLLSRENLHKLAEVVNKACQEFPLSKPAEDIVAIVTAGINQSWDGTVPVVEQGYDVIARGLPDEAHVSELGVGSPAAGVTYYALPMEKPRTLDTSSQIVSSQKPDRRRARSRLAGKH
jgi:hypothetical protein